MGKVPKKLKLQLKCFNKNEKNISGEAGQIKSCLRLAETNDGHLIDI